MEGVDDLLTMLERPTTKSKAVKRKWREIEAMKEQQRLKKELEDFDWGLEDDFLESLS